jgi:hypothetical protein
LDGTGWKILNSIMHLLHIKTKINKKHMGIIVADMGLSVVCNAFRRAALTKPEVPFLCISNETQLE